MRQWLKRINNFKKLSSQNLPLLWQVPLSKGFREVLIIFHNIFVRENAEK